MDGSKIYDFDSVRQNLRDINDGMDQKAYIHKQETGSSMSDLDSEILLIALFVLERALSHVLISSRSEKTNI